MKRSRSRGGQSLVEVGLVAGIAAIIVVASLWLWARSAGEGYQERAAGSTQNESRFYDNMTSAAGDTHLD